MPVRVQDRDDGPLALARKSQDGVAVPVVTAGVDDDETRGRVEHDRVPVRTALRAGSHRAASSTPGATVSARRRRRRRSGCRRGLRHGHDPGCHRAHSVTPSAAPAPAVPAHAMVGCGWPIAAHACDRPWEKRAIFQKGTAHDHHAQAHFAGGRRRRFARRHGPFPGERSERGCGRGRLCRRLARARPVRRAVHARHEFARHGARARGPRRRAARRALRVQRPRGAAAGGGGHAVRDRVDLEVVRGARAPAAARRGQARPRPADRRVPAVAARRVEVRARSRRITC